MKKYIRKIHWILSAQLGLDLRRLFRGLAGLPRYLAGWLRFRKDYPGRIEFMPCLGDWHEEGGTTQTEYFLQDLHVARAIHRANPQKHVDIGSRIDGFVAHLASFREVEVFDIRPVTSAIEGVIFRQADLMNPPESLVDYCDSLSCLHALEHFGLGRYGDPINASGYLAGFENMAKILQRRGTFYLAVPVGQERVAFNAHRIFNPQALVILAEERGFTLHAFAWIGADHQLIQSLDPKEDMRRLAEQDYSLGIFTLIKA